MDINQGKYQKTKENEVIKTKDLSYKKRDLATVRNDSVCKLLSMTENQTFGLHEDENLFD